MTRTTNRPAPLSSATPRAAKPAGKSGTTFVSWAPTDLERASDRAARRGDFDTARVRSLVEDDPRAAFARSLRALGLHACASVMVAKAA